MKTKEKLYIIGAGSVGGHIATNIQGYSENFVIEGFLDDDTEKLGTDFCGYPVLGPVTDALSLENNNVVIGIAFPKIKMELISLLTENKLLNYPPLVHKRAWISNDVQIGKGSVIYPGNSINYGSIIGDFVVMNMNCAVGHHSYVGNFSSLAPGVNLGGYSQIKRGVDVGIGVSTIQGVSIGEDSIIGGNAMVIRDLPANCKAIGVPAREV